MEKEFVKVRSTNDIIISSILLIAGSVLVILPTSDSINIAGFFMLLTGLLLFFVLKTSYKDMETGEKLNKKERYFSHEKYETLKRALTHPETFDPSGEDKGNSIKLDIYYNKSKVYVQLFEYVPYKYEPCSDIHLYHMDIAEKLIK